MPDLEQTSVTGQLITKSLLSIMKHRTVEKAVERCEMSIVEASQLVENEEQDGLESKLVVRLHCKHDAINESNLTIGPRAVKDMIEHFPIAKGAKADPQLIWSFGESEVGLRSLESSFDPKGKAQLATELTISSEEFDVYNIYAVPTTIAFHLREFNATIAFADSMSLTLDLRFTDPAAPLFIDVEGDNLDSLFVISTSQVHGAISGAPTQHYQPSNNRKRERQDSPTEVKNKKPMKAVQAVDRVVHPSHSLPRITPVAIRRSDQEASSGGVPPPSDRGVSREPLFLPTSSQLSVAHEEAIRSSGLGVEHMDADELAQMLDGEGEEVAFDFSSQRPTNEVHQSSQEQHTRDTTEYSDSFDLQIEEGDFEPTQASDNSRMFQPLFQD